jgi:hypothetical protein
MTPRETALNCLRNGMDDYWASLYPGDVATAVAWLESLPDDVGEYRVRAFMQGVMQHRQDTDDVGEDPSDAMVAAYEREARRRLAEGSLGRQP